MSRRKIAPSRQINLEGIASYPQVFEAKTKKRDDGSTSLQYGLDLLMSGGESAQVLEARALAMEVATAYWGNDVSRWPKFRYRAVREQADRMVNQDGSPRLGYKAGDWYINPTSQNQPPVVDAELNKILDRNQLYGGCQVLVRVNAYVYDRPELGNVGVKFGLIAVQKIGEGTPFGMAKPDIEKIFTKRTPVAAAGVAGKNLL